MIITLRFKCFSYWLYYLYYFTETKTKTKIVVRKNYKPLFKYIMRQEINEVIVDILPY
jgi:hypothetical protein